MNVLIFRDESESKFLPFTHPKAVHIKDVLKLENESVIFAGIANKNLYKTKIFKKQDGYAFSDEIELLENPERLNTTICVAFPRPQIAKRILFECACFGVNKVIFYAASKGERDYIKSSLYQKDEIYEQFEKGAEQSCSTYIPEFESAENLQEALEKIDPNSVKIAPDLYEATSSFLELVPPKEIHTSIVFGAERGFNNEERKLLRSHNFTLASLGKRVLRTDSAIIAALATRCVAP